MNLTKNTKNCIMFRMPFGSEFHLSRLGQSLHLPSGIGMAFQERHLVANSTCLIEAVAISTEWNRNGVFITPFGSEFHLSRLGQSLYLPSGIGMAFLSQT